MKQRRFVEAYLGEAQGNATRAAVIAGYSERTARHMGAENLAKPGIAAAIARSSEVETNHAILTRAERHSFLTSVILDASESTRDRLHAADLLAKGSGEYVSRVLLGKMSDEELAQHLVERDPSLLLGDGEDDDAE